MKHVKCLCSSTLTLVANLALVQAGIKPFIKAKQRIFFFFLKNMKIKLEFLNLFVFERIKIWMCILPEKDINKLNLSNENTIVNIEGFTGQKWVVVCTFNGRRSKKSKQYL